MGVLRSRRGIRKVPFRFSADTEVVNYNCEITPLDAYLYLEGLKSPLLDLMIEDTEHYHSPDPVTGIAQPHSVSHHSYSNKFSLFGYV